MNNIKKKNLNHIKTLKLKYFYLYNYKLLNKIVLIKLFTILLYNLIFHFLLNLLI